ncbi:MAG TPA: pentapeptide repeat-containing protein [Bryobacteraceae bacterium]|nr:pentapeptide repeat-containing protein [Bryobacteraceae bacterium]
MTAIGAVFAVLLSIGSAGAAQTASCPVPSGQNYSGQNLTNHNFRTDPPGSLINANFANATLNGAIFAGQDLTGANFQQANLAPSDKGPVDFTSTNLNRTCFIGAIMNATDFTFATITCANFSNTSLMKAQFGPVQNMQTVSGCRTKFNGSTMDVNAIAASNWGKSDFTDAIFQNLSNATFSLAGIDISNAMLGCTTLNTPGCKNFSGIDLTGANLTDADLTGANLVHAKLGHAALNGVIVKNANLKYATLACAQFYGSTPNGNCKTAPPASSDANHAADLTQAMLGNADVSNATMDSAKLSGASLSGVIFRGTSFRAAIFESAGSIGTASILGGDFTGANFENAHLNFVTFGNVILTEALFDQNTTLNGTIFSGSIMPHVNFNNAVLENVQFNATILENAIFTSTTMKTPPSGGAGVSFSCAQLGGATFANATITAAGFTAAVMPPAKDCCPEKSGGPWCGTVDVTQQAYGPVVYPVLQTAIICPNGDVAACAGDQWVIPNWQTNLCTQDHTTQTVWSSPDCGGPVGPIVQFKDANLKQCILSALPGKPAEITLKTAQQIQSVSCPAKEISDLTGLEQFINLTSLDLTANRLTGFALPLTKLGDLKIGYNQLTSLDVSRLYDGGPIRVDASNNQLKTMVGTASVYFEVLDISHNQITTFDLPSQSYLAWADLSYNNLTNVLNGNSNSLSALTSLQYLDLSHNSIPGIGSAAAIGEPSGGKQPVLQSLFLGCNPTFRCSTLQLDGQSMALQKSNCADYNPQNNQWIILTNPLCPAGLRHERKGSR